jgi:hypothetical protein
VIKNQMLIVLSKDRKRALSGELRRKFEDIHSKCMNDRRGNYCLKGVPKPMPPTRAATVVEAYLNKMAKLSISEHNPDLPIFDPAREGEMRRSMQPAELGNMDQVYKS